MNSYDENHQQRFYFASYNGYAYFPDNFYVQNITRNGEHQYRISIFSPEIMVTPESGETEFLFRYIAFSITIDHNTEFLEDDLIPIQLGYYKR